MYREENLPNINKWLVVGFMASGKSSLVRKLPDAVDSDEEILRVSGAKNIEDMVQKKGWEEFRQLEYQIVRDFIQDKQGKFISIGAGGWTRELFEFSQKYRPGLAIVWLRPQWSTIEERLKQQSFADRPLLKLGEKQIHQLYLQRKEQYELADFALNEKDVDKIDNFDDFLSCIAQKCNN
jgi:shikimate kinase